MFYSIVRCIHTAGPVTGVHKEAAKLDDLVPGKAKRNREREREVSFTGLIHY